MYYSTVLFKKKQEKKKKVTILFHLSDVCGNKNTTAAWERHHLRHEKHNLTDVGFSGPTNWLGTAAREGQEARKEGMNQNMLVWVCQ